MAPRTVLWHSSYERPLAAPVITALLLNGNRKTAAPSNGLYVRPAPDPAKPAGGQVTTAKRALLSITETGTCMARLYMNCTSSCHCQPHYGGVSSFFFFFSRSSLPWVPVARIHRPLRAFVIGSSSCVSRNDDVQKLQYNYAKPPRRRPPPSNPGFPLCLELAHHTFLPISPFSSSFQNLGFLCSRTSISKVVILRRAKNNQDPRARDICPAGFYV